ncbi:MAG: hypothetical protein PHE27_05500 [Alphaproteobacteria bacterium]|nr:hypothetical protein [Alphaproteobacteria bacterium]
MRIWEFEDKKETPSDLVREQDFILRVRRMQRTGLPSLVLNFILSSIPDLQKSQSVLEAVQNKLRAYARSTNGSYYEMSNGDAFLVWENPGEARLMSTRAIEAALEPYEDSAATFLQTYRMPENYALLRERTNAYVEEVRTKTMDGSIIGRIDETTGRLTAKNIEQIERLIGDMDVRRFGRSQSIYRDGGGTWTPVAEEYFISFEEFRREHFPKLDIVGSEHYFFAICSLLDQKLLSEMTESYASVEGRTINLNLSIASIMGSTFAQFVRVVPRHQRHLVGFELHCGDLFQDFSLTLSAMEVLRREGFRVTVDSVLPNMIPYFNLTRFPVDRVKVNVSKDAVSQFIDPVVRKEFERVPADKVVFFRCDNPRALELGRETGISIFQGWLIDDMVAKAAKG